MLTTPVDVGATFAAATLNGVPNAVPMAPEPVVRFTVLATAEPVPVMLPLPLVIMLTTPAAPVAPRAALTTMLPLDTPNDVLSTIESVPVAVKLLAKVIGPVPRNPSVPPIVPAPPPLVTVSPLLTSVIVTRPPVLHIATFFALTINEEVLVPMVPPDWKLTALAIIGLRVFV